ncbi:hypothetical protein K3495_g13970 [Podosphaera aphanis]|nr:hypothetical protein K3495_g13970 [Podosphaera aphanis]
MPAQNQKRDSYLSRQSRTARPESSHVNRIFDESVNSPYERRRVQGRAECQKRGGQSLFEYDSNSRFEPQNESPSQVPRLAWGDIQSKEATNKALDKANLMASKDQMNAARRLMASASFAGELGLEWVFWPETEPYQLSNAVDSCWEMVQNDAARTAEDTIPTIEELLARNVRDYLTEKRNQFRCFCSEQVQGLLPVARLKDGEDHFVFWKNLTDDFKILCKPPKDGGVPLDNEGRPKKGYRMFLSDIVVRCLAYFWSRQYNHYHKFPLAMKAGWFDPFNGHTIVHTCANIMWAAMERRDTRHGGVRKQDSSDANPLFQAIKTNWLDLDSNKRRSISDLLTYKVKRLTEFASGENEIEAAPNDFKGDCQDVEQDSDYEEASVEILRCDKH